MRAITGCLYAIAILCLYAEPAPAQGIVPMPGIQTCEESARNARGGEFQKAAARAVCERERMAETVKSNSNQFHRALTEYMGAVESRMVTGRQIADQGKDARCPSPGVYNDSVPLCSALITRYDQIIKENWDKAQATLNQITQDLSQLARHDSRLMSDVSEVQNDRTIKFWMLAAFLLIVVAALAVVIFVAWKQPRMLPDMHFNARSVGAFALVILPLFFGFLIDSIPESLIVAVVSGASGWLFGTTTAGRPPASPGPVPIPAPDAAPPSA